MKKLAKVALTVLSCAAIMGLSACGGSATSENGQDASGTQTATNGTSHYINEDGLVEVNIQRAERIHSLNIWNYLQGPNFAFAEMIFDALYTTNHGGICEPCICTGYDLNEDGTEVTLHIAEGVKFFDGSDCDADDIYTQMQYIADHKDEMAVFATYWQTLEKAEKIDQYTVKLYLSNPSPFIEDSLAYTFIAKAEEIEQYGSDLFSSVDTLNGTGRWKMEEWVDGQYVKFTRNYDYWQGGDFTNVDVLYYWYISDPTAQNAAFINGDIDYIDGVNVDLESMLDAVSDQCRIEEKPTEVKYYFQFKMDGTAPTSDQNLRYAIMHAIDREALCELVGGAIVMNDFYTLLAEGHQEDLPALEYDPELAKEYLAKSNYNGETLVLVSRTDIGYADSFMTAVADYLNQIGINTRVDMVDNATMNTRRAEGDYDIFMVNLLTWDGNALTQDLVPRIVQDMHHHGYVNEELNEMIMDAAYDLNPETRTKTLEEIGDILYELQGPMVSMIQINRKNCIRNGLTGLIESPSGYIFTEVAVDEAYL